MRSPLRILHLEDDPSDVELIQLTLDREGLDCATVHVETRDEFVAALECETFDLILADYSLPSFDGLTALGIAKEKCPDIPFILLSGTLGEELAIDSLKAGATDYVLKQRLSRLAPAVDRAMREAEEQTRRQKAEQALKDGEERYRLHFENVGDVIYSIDMEMRVADISPSVERVLGYKSEEIIGRRIDELGLLAPEYHAQAFSNSERVLAGEQVGPSEYEFIAKDGRRVFAEVSAAPIFKDGKVIGGIDVARDVTEAKRVENALRESEEKFRTIAETSSVAIYLTDEQGKCVYANPLWLQHAGMPLEEALGDGWACALHPDDREKVLTNWRQMVESHGQWGFEYRFLSKEGTTAWVWGTANEITDALGNTSGYVGINVDITERKQAEEEKEELQARLRQAQKMEAIGILAGGVAHDLNNILSGITGYPELLLLNLPEDSPLRNPLQRIKDSGEKAATIVQDMLTLARSGVPLTDAVNINEIILEYLESPVWEKVQGFHPDVQLKTELDADLMNIKGSSTHLSEIVMNLVSNAAEAMPAGGHILISTANQYLDKSVKGYDNAEEGEYTTLSVSDTGVGLTPEDAERIFEPFFTKKTLGRSGTGLGTTIVWRTVKDHNGYIDVQSEEGKGTTFTLYFPITREQTAEAKADVSMEEYMGAGQSILIVDDVKEQRELARGMLEALGYSVKTAPSGEGAIEYLESNSADLLVLDMIMEPGIDGLETHRRIVERHPGQKAIIASGFSESDKVREAQALGAGAYIRKPYTIEKIGLAIKAELEK